MSKFKVGDRVRVLESPEYNTYTHRKFVGEVGVVTYISGDFCTIDDFPNNRSDGGFHMPNLELVTSNSKENKPMGRRTFKLIKETPEYKVGTLFQEACDDGDQEYIVITRDLLKFEDANADNQPSYERVEVETQPQWFVEVFKVEPEYMTREQLDAYQAFLGQKKRGRPVGSKTKKAAPTTKAKMAASWTPERRKAQARRMRKLHKQRKLGAK